MSDENDSQESQEPKDEPRYEYKPSEPSKPPESQEKEKDWREVVKPQQEKKKRGKWMYLGIIVIAFVAGYLIFTYSPLNAVTGMFLGFTQSQSGEGAQSGDTVKVMYVGKLQNGEVFDTNRESVAQEAGLERDFFQALEFRIGTGQMIPGFEEAVIGMEEGGKKTFTLSPEKAYGQKDPTLISEIPREQELEREEDVPLNQEVPADQFLQLFGVKKVGDIISPVDSPLEYKVKEIGDEIITVTLLLEEDKNYQFPGFEWKSEVISMNETSATVRHNPTETVEETPIGKVEITVTDDKVIITTTPEVGMEIPTFAGVVKVIAVDEKNFTIDANHFLAGETLTFEVEVLEIERPNNSE